MTTFDNPYSRLVAWLKIVLPLAALALLSTMFLLSRTHTATPTLPFVEVDVTELAAEQRIRSPNYTGMTQDGSAISMTAETAKPDLANRDIILADDLRAELQTATGITYDLLSQAGQINTAESIAYLEGGVVIVASNGYTLSTEALTTSLSETAMETPGPVQLTGPGTKLNAGRMTLSDGSLLVFKDGVKVIYTPSTTD